MLRSQLEPKLRAISLIASVAAYQRNCVNVNTVIIDPIASTVNY